MTLIFETQDFAETFHFTNTLNELAKAKSSLLQSLAVFPKMQKIFFVLKYIAFSVTYLEIYRNYVISICFYFIKTLGRVA